MAQIQSVLPFQALFDPIARPVGKTALFFWSFPYVCPESVLAK
jgi:hypothetical protein